MAKKRSRDLIRLSRLLRERMGAPLPDDPKKTHAEAIVDAVMREAVAGTRWAIEMVRDTTEGRPGPADRSLDEDRSVQERLSRVNLIQINQFAQRARGITEAAIASGPKAGDAAADFAQIGQGAKSVDARVQPTVTEKRTERTEGFSQAGASGSGVAGAGPTARGNVDGSDGNSHPKGRPRQPPLADGDAGGS